MGGISLLYRLNASTGKPEQVSKKLIEVNGTLSDRVSNGGVEGADYFLLLSGDEAVRKYGRKAQPGLIEAVGANLKILKSPPPPPAGPPPSYK